MIFKLQFFLVLTILINFSHNFNASAGGGATAQAAQTDSDNGSVTKPYRFTPIPEQNRPFTPSPQPGFFAGLLQNLPWSTTTPENPHQQIFDLIDRGQINDACSLCSCPQTKSLFEISLPTKPMLGTKFPHVQEFFSRVLDEKIGVLPIETQNIAIQTLLQFESNRQKLEPQINNIARLIRAGQGNVLLQRQINDHKILMCEAIDRAQQNISSLLGVLVAEITQTSAALEQLKEILTAHSGQRHITQ